MSDKDKEIERLREITKIQLKALNEIEDFFEYRYSGYTLNDCKDYVYFIFKKRFIYINLQILDLEAFL